MIKQQILNFYNICKKWIFPYIFAIILVGIAGICYYSQITLTDTARAPLFIWFYPAVIFTVFFKGAGPGILATILSAMTAIYYFIEPTSSFMITRSDDRIAIIVFITMGIIISFIGKYVTNLQLQTKQAILTSLEYNRTLLEVSIDPILTVDINGKIMDVNQSTINIIGIPRNELIGSDVCKYFTEPEKAEIGYKQVFENEQVRDYPLTFQNQKTNKNIDVSFNAVVYKNQKNEIAGIFAAARDITNFKVTEQLLQDSIKLTTKLNKSNEDLDKFNYYISHDLRAPLRAIDGFISILLNKYTDKLDDEAKRLLNIISDNAKQMANLIESILYFSRTGKLIIHPIPINMNNLVQKMWDVLILSEPTTRDITLKLHDLPETIGDLIMIQDIIQNLLDNALKFTNKNKQTIIEVDGYIKDNEIIYSIKDNGVGFNIIYLPKLFNLFQRLHNVNEFPGNGIGLAITKQLIQKHNGRIWVETEINKGTTFYIALPILKGEI